MHHCGRVHPGASHEQSRRTLQSPLKHVMVQQRFRSSQLINVGARQATYLEFSAHEVARARAIAERGDDVGNAGGGQEDSELARMLRGGALDVKARRACTRCSRCCLQTSASGLSCLRTTDLVAGAEYLTSAVGAPLRDYAARCLMPLRCWLIAVHALHAAAWRRHVRARSAARPHRRPAGRGLDGLLQGARRH